MSADRGGARHGHHWSDEDDDRIREMWLTHTAEQIGKKIVRSEVRGGRLVDVCATGRAVLGRVARIGGLEGGRTH